MAFGQFDIAITGDSTRFRAELNKVTAAAKASGKEIENAFGARIQEVSRRALGALTGALGFAAVTREMATVFQKTVDAQRALEQFTAVLKSTGYAAGLTAGDLDKLGKELADVTVFDDDDIKKAQTALLRFREVSGDTFREVLRLAPSVATVLGTDLTNAVQLLGRAVTDPERGLRALKDTGLRLSEQQIDLAARFIESGEKAKAMKIVLDELGRSVGGVSAGDTKGLYGQTRNLARAWDELQKTAGRKLFGNDSAVARELTISLQGLVFALENIDRLRLRFQPGTMFLTPYIAPPPPPGRDTGIKRIGTELEERFQAALGEIQAEAGAESDKRYKEEQEGFRLRAAKAAQFYGGQLALQKDFLERTEVLAEFAYSRGTLTTDEFFDSQERRAREAFRLTANTLGELAHAQGELARAPSTTREGAAAARLEIDRLSQQMDAERVKMGTKLIQVDQQRELAIEKLGDSYSELAEKVALAAGEESKAARLAFERETRDARRAAQVVRDRGGGADSAAAAAALADIERLGRQSDARARLTEVTRAYGNVIDDLGVAQAKSDLAVERGSLTELDSLSKRAQIAREYIPLLEAQAAALEKVAAATPKGPDQDAALSRLAQLRLEMERLAVASEAAGRKINEQFGSAFSDQVTAVLDGTKSLKDAFKDLAKSWVHVINELAAKQLAISLFGAGGPASGLGGLLASLFGAGTGAGTGAGIGAGTAGSLIPAGPFPYASGTAYHRGGWALVGERGPELLRLPRGSAVMPHEQSKQMMNSRSIVQNINVLPGVTKQSAAQASAEMARMLMRGQRNM